MLDKPDYNGDVTYCDCERCQRGEHPWADYLDEHCRPDHLTPTRPPETLTGG